MKVSEVQLSYKSEVKPSDRVKVNSSEGAYNTLKPFYNEVIEHREASYVLLLSRANKVLGVFKLSEGGTSGTTMDSKLLFQSAILANASAVILSHNHPAGSLKPSVSDRRVTDKLVEVGKLLDIPVLDHLILTSEGYYSFADEGEM